MKSILYIGGFELPDKNAAAQRVLANAMLFREIGYDVTFIGISKREDSRVNHFIAEGDNICGFKNYYIKYPTSVKDWLVYLTTVKHITSTFENKDIIIAYNYPSISLFKLHIWCKNNNKILISDCTEWYQTDLSFLGLIKRTDTFLRMKIIQPRLSGLIAISEYLHLFYSSKMKNVIQLPPLVDKSNNKWSIISSNNPRLQSRDIKLIYAGSIGAGRKDKLSIVLDSLSILKEKNYIFSFRVIGVSLEEYISNLHGSIPENIKNDVYFLGRINHVEALSEVAKSDYQIFFRENNLTNKAGFPTKFVESISCGTAVISNSSSNISDYVVNNKNGFIIDISNNESISDSLSHIFSSKVYPQVESCIFDYHNYLENVKEFINKIKE